MNLPQLYYFRKLAEVQHYTEAAKALYITQPSLSDSIASLEKELGVSLFQKKGRNIQLTKYGEEFYQYVSESLSILEHGISLIKEKSGHISGSIDIGCIPTLLGDFLPEALDLYQEKNPLATLNIYHGMSIEVAQGVSCGKYDIGFCSMVDGMPDLVFVPITYQELIAIVVLAAVAVAYLVMLRKSDDGASVPKWLAWLSVALSVVLVAVMAHSYTMAARPAWDSVLWILYVLGNACVLGPATFQLIMAAVGAGDRPAERAADVGALAGRTTLVGAAANAAAAIAFAIFLQLSAGSFADVGYYFDPTHPTKAMADAAATVASQAPLLWAGAVAVGALAPVAAAFMGKRSGNWRLWAPVAIIAALIGAVCMRVAFYNLGLSVFMFY